MMGGGTMTGRGTVGATGFGCGVAGFASGIAADAEMSNTDNTRGTDGVGEAVGINSAPTITAWIANVATAAVDRSERNSLTP